MRPSAFSECESPSGAEAEFQPGSRGRVLRNRLRIYRKREMDQVEYEALLRTQEAYLHRIEPETRFTAALLCRMHHDWLGEIYESAIRKGRNAQLICRSKVVNPVKAEQLDVLALRSGVPSLLQAPKCCSVFAFLPS